MTVDYVFDVDMRVYELIEIHGPRTPDRQPCNMPVECTGNDKDKLDEMKTTLAVLLTIT